MVSQKSIEEDRRWAWIVIVAVFCGKIIVSTSLYMAGVFYLALLDYFHDDITKTSLIGALNSGIMCFLGPLSSSVIDRFSCRTCMLLGSVLLSLSYLISAFINNINGLILTLGVLGGIANALVSIPFNVSLGYYCDKQRNTVIVASTTVIGLAMFFASPLALFLINSYGLKGTFMMVSAIAAHVCVCGVVCKPSTQEIEIQMLKTRKHTDTSSKGPKTILKKVQNCCSLSFVRLLKDLSYVFYLLSTCSWNFMLLVCLLHLPNYVQSKGLDQSAVTLMMTTFSISNTLGRLLPVFTLQIEKINSLLMNVLMLGVAGIVTLTFPWYSHLNASGYIYAAFAGFFTGGPTSLMTPISLKLVGVENLSSAHGLEILFCGLGALAGPIAAGWLYERTGSYENSFMMSGAVVLTGCLFGVLPYIRSIQKKNAMEIPRTEFDMSDRADTNPFKRGNQR